MYIDKGYSIRVILYRVCGIGLCLGVKESLCDQSNYFNGSLELVWGVNLSKEVIKCCNSLIRLCLGAKKKNFIDEIVQITTCNWFEKLL